MSKPSTQSDRPNIVWISLEDTSLRFGCYGDNVARTPNIDRLASEGTLYTNAYSTAAVCSPSRNAIITGMYATSIGAHHHRTSEPEHTEHTPTPYEVVPPPYVKTFTEYLRASGYYCTNNEKTDYQFKAPITAWDENGNTAHWRHRSDHTQPFFAVFNLMATHESGMWRPYESLTTNPDDVLVPPYLPDTQKSREALALHYDNLELNDNRVGGLLQQLEDDGLADNTVVFIWSDHGEGLPRHKRWLYDSGIHVPLIVRWPGRLEPGTTTDQLVSMIDLGPTVLRLAGVPVPKHMQGQAFLAAPTLNLPERTYVFAARDRHDEIYDMVRAVRDGRYKYIRNCYPEKCYFDWVPYGHNHGIMQEMWRLYALGELNPLQKRLIEGGRPPEELYDCLSDPHEVHNLAGDSNYREVLDRMSEELDQWRTRVGDMGEIPEAQMANLMWPNGIQPVTAPVQFVPIADGAPGTEDVAAGQRYEFKAPVVLLLCCGTQGASIAYTLDDDEYPRWRLYTSPVVLGNRTSTVTVRARAIRIGYGESEESHVTIHCN
ncbi:arylsulfatase A-like enzyme [Paenibacillus taihuensis]|uniref:Arylsulfatase A-like enzyme n=1 Tax=Paenibacillus taihuensis TaxID=1156355 RepID=A0A3D9S7I8_9BACL|nr:sulfatase-like hydrolase/transferase [Paenibacillus taihuensis]REE88994.1 arylsulfatase A-like enzyme [Paenibacillus taihuensis]